MTDQTNHPFRAAPPFIREREAWLRAGAGAMGGYAAVIVALMGIVASIASLFHEVPAYQVAILIVFGTWSGLAITNSYIDMSARRLAEQGGVEIDRF